MDDVMSAVLEELRRAQAGPAGNSIGFGEPLFSPLHFSKDNFRRIDIGEAQENVNVAFIDGGNSEIFSSPGMCVHFVRIHHSIYRNNVRISCSSDSFYALASARSVDGRLVYSAKLFRSGVKTLTDSFFAEEFIMDPQDKSLAEGSSRMALSRMPGLVRRIAELSTALLLASSMEKDDVIVIDGDLAPRFDDEKKVIAAIRQLSASRGVFACALSKTSSFLTSGAESAASFLDRLAPQGMDRWCYSPVAAHASSGHNISFVKLHPKSSYVFRLDSFGEPKKVLPLLAKNSTDPVFLGYPYGLVEADRFARVSNSEADFLRTIFMVKAGKDWSVLDSDSRSMSAHSVLDRISY